MKVVELFEEREHILISMVKKLLAANAKILMHHGDPELMKLDPEPGTVYDIDDGGDHIAIHVEEHGGSDVTSATITRYDDASKAKLIKRKSKSKRPVWDLFILS